MLPGAGVVAGSGRGFDDGGGGEDLTATGPVP